MLEYDMYSKEKMFKKRPGTSGIIGHLYYESKISQQNDMGPEEETFKKRSGTSGISGHLYETKLISLILFRLQHNDKVIEYELAGNMDDIGAFDDICLKANITELNKPLLVFIQAKHKDEDNTFLKYNLIKHFHASLLKVREKFNTYSKHKNDFFRHNLNDVECLFILYTNARFFDKPNSGKLDQTLTGTAPGYTHVKRQCQKEYADILNDIIGTNNSKGYHLDYNNVELEFIAQTIVEEEIAILAEHFAKFLNNNEKQSMNIMLDEYMIRYSVFLRQNVVDVSEIQSHTQTKQSGSDKPKAAQTPSEDWRCMTFRTDFFQTDNNILAIFRNKIYEFLIKNRGNTKKSKKIMTKTSKDLSEDLIDEQISSFLVNPSVSTLSYIIDKHVTCRSGKLEFLVDRSASDQQKLEQIDILPTMIYEAQVLNFLRHLILKVPVSFGNLDMTLKGNQKKVDKRIKRLTDFMIELCQRSEFVDPYEIVTIDEDIEEDILSTSGGIGGAVGNLFVYDNETKLMKFTKEGNSLDKNAKALYDQLVENVNNLSSYRFFVKAINFPKLVIDCTEEAKGVLDKLMIYEKQSNQSGVEEILKKQILKYEKDSSTQPFIAKLEALFMCYHHEILEWWMSNEMQYLTKSKDIYQRAVNNIFKEPQISALQNTFFNNIKNRSYIFNDDAINSFNSLKKLANIIIVTDVASLMVMKVIQYLRNKDGSGYTVLDLKYAINLPIKEFRALNSELIDTEKTIIIVCNSVENSGVFLKRLVNISEAVKQKEIIIITTKDFYKFADLDLLMEYFEQINHVLDDEKINLTDLIPESQNSLVENAKVIFQGKETNFTSVVDEDSLIFATGVVLNKITGDETIVIGESLSNYKYEEIKHLYVNRRVSRGKAMLFYVDKFDDIDEDYVIISAEPGMGKSILLTHLALKTQEHNNNIWIVRINLIVHSKEFYDWEKNKTVMHTLEVIRFLCQILLKNKELPICLGEVNEKIFLETSTGDEWANFELNMFLHYYNIGKLLLLFDGFDEICPHYKNIVLNLLRTVKAFPRKNKMLVTSRPYNEILPDLENVVGNSYKIEYITDEEHEQYLNDIWKSRIALEKLTDIQLSNLRSFAHCIRQKILKKSFPDSMHFTFRRMYYLFYYFVQNHIENNTKVADDEVEVSPEIPHPPPQPIASTSAAADSANLSARLVDKLVGTPLLLYLVAEYFINIVSNNERVEEWELNIKIIKIYESFIETKFKNILFEDKNKIDIYKADVITRFEKERAECIDMHKKLGAYAALKNKIFYDVCPLDEFKDMQPLSDKAEFETVINVIKSAKEKTGLVSYVTLDNVPVFVHKTFAEYFAMEYLCDIFTSEIEFDHKKLLYTAIYTYGALDIRPWLKEKMKIDPNLDSVIKEIFSKKLVVLSWHRELFSRGDWGIDRLLRLLSSGPDDYIEDWCSNVKEDYADILNSLEPEKRRKRIRKFQVYIIAKMKPHLKQYFGPVIPLRGYFQMINWMGGKIGLP